MRIAHVIDNMYLDRGGPVAVVAGLASAQAASGEEVGIVCRRQVRPAEVHTAVHRFSAGVTMLETGGSGSGGVSTCLGRFRPDVIHMHGVWEANLRWAAAWAQRRDVPWVLSTHGMLHRVPMRKGWLKKRLYLTILGSAIKGARRLLVTNTEEASFAFELVGVESTVLVNGVSLGDFSSTSVTSAPGLIPGLPSRPYLLFLGRIHELKGIDGLIRSFAIARSSGVDTDLVLAGPPDGFEKTVTGLARDLGVGDRVHQVGALYGQAKIDALAGCRLLVHRPRYEGFGMTIVEAMAAGRPVLTTAASGVARECPAGVLDACEDTDEGFAARIIHHCSPDHAAETESMAERGRDWVRRELTWDVIARRVRSIYR